MFGFNFYSYKNPKKMFSRKDVVILLLLGAFVGITMRLSEDRYQQLQVEKRQRMQELRMKFATTTWEQGANYTVSQIDSPNDIKISRYESPENIALKIPRAADEQVSSVVCALLVYWSRPKADTYFELLGKPLKPSGETSDSSLPGYDMQIFRVANHFAETNSFARLDKIKYPVHATILAASKEVVTSEATLIKSMMDSDIGLGTSGGMRPIRPALPRTPPDEKMFILLYVGVVAKFEKSHFAPVHVAFIWDEAHEQWLPWKGVLDASVNVPVHL